MLAFVLALREAGREPEWRELPLRFVPAALIAVGAVYAYSYPGLIWLAGAALVWLASSWRAAAEAPCRARALARRRPRRCSPSRSSSRPRSAAWSSSTASRPSTPTGPGSATSSARSRPSRRSASGPRATSGSRPGDGAVPALGYYLGAAFAAILLALRARPLLAPARDRGRLPGSPPSPPSTCRPRSAAPPTPPRRRSRSRRRSRASCHPAAAAAAAGRRLFALAAGGCSLLALANAPVGPTEYSPALTGLRPLVADGSTLVLASDRLLDEEHGERYLVWELRGGRVCVGRASAAGAQGGRRRGRATSSPKTASATPPFPAMRLRRAPAPTSSGRPRQAPGGPSPCP